MFSKMERKIMKKQAKAIRILMRHDGITTVQHATKNLYVGNGGLGNCIKHKELFAVFSKFGTVKSVVMIPEKPYSFIIYHDIGSAERAHIETNGRLLASPGEVSIPGVKFYTSFVEEVPRPGPSSLCRPSGLAIQPDFIDESYEKQMLDSLCWEESNCNASAKKTMKHRRVKHYGFEFIYGKNNVDKDNPLPEGIPSICDKIVEKAIALGYIRDRPNQLTINQYQPGQGIPPHVDTHSAFDDGILSLSLGSQVVMEFRNPEGYHVPIILPRRSLLVMKGESRYLWSHGITPRKTDIIPSTDSRELTLNEREMRTSFTFRTVRRQPCCCKYAEQCDSQTSNIQRQTKLRTNLPSSDEEAVELEKTHVHQVYNDIACHFSDTRHSPWPKVAEFLNTLPEGSLVADVGCGNGKYLGVNKKLCMIGNDHSINLAQICGERSHHVFVCDCLSIPLRSMFDACICIAVIHHLSTRERRLAAVQEIVKILCKGGKALIYVWALEQELNNEKSNYLKSTKTENAEVSKHVTPKNGVSSKDHCGLSSSTNLLTSDCITDKISHADASEVSSSSATISTQTDSMVLPIHVNRTQFEKQDVLVPWHMKAKQQIKRFSGGTPDELNKNQNRLSLGETAPVFHRFYHVYRQGELELMCLTLSNVKVIHSYYDKGNWCAIIQKL